MTFKIYYKGEFIFKIAERQLQERQDESVSILVFLLEPVNVALGVMGELVSLGVIIGVVGLLANSIRGIGDTGL